MAFVVLEECCNPGAPWGRLGRVDPPHVAACAVERRGVRPTWEWSDPGPPLAGEEAGHLPVLHPQFHEEDCLGSGLSCGTVALCNLQAAFSLSPAGSSVVPSW